MKNEFKTPAQRERARRFALQRGQVWHKGARVTRRRKAK